MPIIFMLLAFAFAAAIEPVIIAYAEKKGLYDRGGARKIHNGNIPRLGGVGIAVSFMLSIAVLGLFQKSLIHDFSEKYRLWPVIVSGSMMFILGLIDDLVDLRARFKFGIQLCAAVLLISVGFRFRVVPVPWGDGMLDFGIFSYPLTLIWIIGITNALNLIDGLDGLAGGISFIASLSFGIFFWAQDFMLSAEICFILSGAAAGFLLYNEPPARIFMGDSGSLFLGFCLAVLPLLGQSDKGAEIGLVSASTILAIPIFDTFAAMYRRRRAGVSFFTADKMHLHHVLLGIAKSVVRVLVIIYGMNIVLSAAALSTLYLPENWSFALKILALFLIAAFFMYFNRDAFVSSRKAGKTSRPRSRS